MGLVGFKWVDTGFTHPVGMDTIRCVAYGEAGVCLAGAQDLAYLFRSTDYGLTWSNLGVQFSQLVIGHIAYMGDNAGSKTWIAGTRNDGKIIRSTDDGLTWADIGQVTAGQVYVTAVYNLGSGVAVAGTFPNGHIYRTTDWGVSWSDLGDLFSETYIARFCRVSDTLLLAGTSPNGLILKSADNGVTWDNTWGSIGEDNLNDIKSAGPSVLLAATSDAVNGARVFRSINDGESWTQVATQLINEDSANSIAYMGNGVAVCATWPKAESWRTQDYGVTWESRGWQFDQIDFFDIAYLESGILIGGTTAGAVGKILRSTEYDEGGSGMAWNNAGAVMVLAPNAHSKGNGTVAANTGNVPSSPNDTYQNIVRTNMGVGFGFVPNSGDGYENFDGANDFIESQYEVAVAGTTTNLTIETKCNLDLSALVFLWGLDDGTPEIFLYVDTDGSIYSSITTTAAYVTETNAGAVSASGDHTITFRITNGLIAVFVDGVEAGGVGYASQGTIITNITYTTTLKIGTKSGSSNFDSKLYWFAIYEESLSLSRITDNHALDNAMGLIGNNTGDILTLSEGGAVSVSRKHGISASTYSNLILDQGAIYTGTFTSFASPGTLVGATRGGSTFSLEEEVREMEVDGALGPVKGSRRITRVTAKLTCNFIEASTGLLEKAVVAGVLTASTPASGWSSLSRNTRIASTDYIDNVALIAEVAGKTNAMGIVLSNVIVDQNLELAFTDKEETVIPVTFTAHFDVTDLDAEPWVIYYPTA